MQVAIASYPAHNEVQPMRKSPEFSPFTQGREFGLVSRMAGEEELERLEPPTHQARALRKSWLAGRLGASEPVFRSAGRGVKAVTLAGAAFIEEFSAAAIAGTTSLSSFRISLESEPSAASSAAAAS